MSGKPNRYASDSVKHRNQYMETLELRANIDDMNLQANKTYKATGQLPPVSQMPETRTTTEILADNERLKIELIKDLAPVGDSHFAQAVIQRIQNSPLNTTGSLFVYFAQRAPEIVIQLKKLYKYKIKGDSNDVETMASFVEDMFAKTKAMTSSVSSFFTQTENKKHALNKLKDLEDIYSLFKDIARRLSLKAKPSSAIGKKCNDIASGLQLYTQFLSNDQINKIVMMMANENAPGFAYNIGDTNKNRLDEYYDVFKRYNEILEQFPSSDRLYTLLNQLDQTIINKNDDLTNRLLTEFLGLLNMIDDVKDLIGELRKLGSDLRRYYVQPRDLDEEAEEAYFNDPNNPYHTFDDDDDDDEGGGGGGEEDDSSRFKLLLENGSLEEPTPDKIPDWLLQSEIPEWLYNIMKGTYSFLPPYTYDTEYAIKLNKPSRYDTPEWLYDVPEWLYNIMKKTYTFLPKQQFLLIKNEPETQEQQIPTNQLPEIKLQPSPLPKQRDTGGGGEGEPRRISIDDIKKEIDTIDKDIIKYNKLINETEVKMKSPASHGYNLTKINQAKKDLRDYREKIKDLNKRLDILMKKYDDYMEQNQVPIQQPISQQIPQNNNDDENSKRIKAEIKALEEEINTLKKSVVTEEEYLKKLTLSGNADEYYIEETNRNIASINRDIKRIENRINEKKAELKKASGNGFKKRRGRPRGCGIVKQKPYSESVKAHVSYDKGIMESPRFVKFGKYLINNHKLNNDDIFALKQPSGGALQEFPSVRLSKHLSNVIKKMVGGGVPSYNDLNGLSEPEKAYLHKVSTRSNIVDKFSIPAPSKDQYEKDIHEFEVLKGEIMAGNDSKELIKKFKLHLIKLSKMGSLPKREVSEVMEELIQLGY